jgi:hypothetical protein
LHCLGVRHSADKDIVARLCELNGFPSVSQCPGAAHIATKQQLAHWRPAAFRQWMAGSLAAAAATTEDQNHELVATAPAEAPSAAAALPLSPAATAAAAEQSALSVVVSSSMTE